MSQPAAAKQSWNRAKALADLTDASPAKARGILSDHKEYQPLFEGKADKRNPQVRAACDEFLATLNGTPKPTKTRASKGDPNRPPRAGAPTPKASGWSQTELQNNLADLVGLADPESLDTQTLFDLKDLAQKYGGIPNLAYALAFLNNLQQGPTTPSRPRARTSATEPWLPTYPDFLAGNPTRPKLGL